MEIRIGEKSVGSGKTFIIAEAGVNHNGSMDIARKMVDEAAKSGVDAIKFQTFLADKIVTPDACQADYQSVNTGKRESQYDMLKRLELSYDDFIDLKKYCDSKGILFLSTPHSCKEDVDLIAKLCPAIKFGSGDITNIPILKYAAGKGLPLILGTGMSTMEEVKEAVDYISPVNKNIILLHCTTNYPTPLNEVNLMAMKTMEKLGYLVGYSDHTMSTNIPAAAVALGACVIEKHFTLDKNMEGPDHKASLEPHELKKMAELIREVENSMNLGRNYIDIIKELHAEDALGNGIKKPFPSEIETAKVGRKSIVASVDIIKGDIITEDMLAVKRPASGLAPKYYWSVVGKKAKADIRKNDFILLDMLV